MRLENAVQVDRSLPFIIVVDKYCMVPGIALQECRTYCVIVEETHVESSEATHEKKTLFANIGLALLTEEGIILCRKTCQIEPELDGEAGIE